MEVALRSTGYLLSLQSRAMLMPLSLLKLWLTASANLFVTLLALVGLMPNEYANRVKINELNRHVDIMHQREAVLMQRLEAMSAEVEAQSRDKSRALRKMHRARTDMQSLAASLEDLQSSAAATAGIPTVSGSSGRGGASAGVLGHALLWSAVLSTYLCSRTMAKLEFKLLLTVIIPAVLLFLAPGDAPARGWRAAAVQCVSSGVLGFTLNHLLC
mmetsp:Transcript_11510/g.34570  ORF Transcript_11510/g.34570 Transcript_11510/m.34570 type:complete len:215 (+) Transcript_11510:686-1330(+)